MESPVYWYKVQEFIQIFCLHFKYQFICCEIFYIKWKWYTTLFHGIQQFIHHIINNRFLWWFIVPNMVVCFALRVGKESWWKSAIRWNNLLFDWRFFRTKTCSFKGIDYWSNSLWMLVSLWLSNYSLTGGSVAALWWHTYCCMFVSSLHFISNSFDIFLLVTSWAVVESLLPSFSYDSSCIYSTFIRWAPVALLVSISIFK